MKRTIYSFIGLPASGKGTQTALLSKRTGALVVGIGSLIRGTIEENSSDPFVAEIRQRYDKGIPQPDEIAVDLVKNYLMSHLDRDIILDNFPFGNKQAAFVDQFLADNNDWQLVLIYLQLNPESVIRRITQRKVCSECGAIYDSTEDMICEKCGGALTVRADDNVDVAKRRIEEYYPKIQETLNHYRNLTKIITVDGEKPIEDISSEINRQL